VRSETNPLLLVLDGNSLLHRAYHAAATGKLLDRDERPVWALKGLVGYAARAAAQFRPDAVVIGFDCPHESVRTAAYPAYKAHRPEKAADLAVQVVEAPDVLSAAGLTIVAPRGLEADDVLASCAATARRAGWRSMLMTSDRDAFALIDDTTSVLRIRNGGFDQAVLVTPSALFDQYGVRPTEYRDYAALRGDPSDNLPGVPGFGSATAARLLRRFGSVEAAWTAWDNGDDQSIRDLVGARAADHFGSGAAREILQRNRALMTMHDDLAVPDPETIRLPLRLAVMKAALSARGIILGPSLWALTGGAPPPEGADASVVPHAWLRRTPRARRQPLPGQLALF
jgi:DNA polymerase-1